MQTLRENIAKTRKEFDGTFGQVDDIPGLPTSAMRGIERFGQALGQVQDRLAGAEGSAIDGWVHRQGRVAEKFQNDVIDPMQKSLDGFLAKGDTKNAEAVAKSLADARASLTNFNETVERTAALEKSKAGAKIGARAEGVLGRFGNNLDNMSAQLDAFEERFTNGKVSPEAEAAKVNSQFAPMIRQIENMKLAVGQLKGAEGDRAETLGELAAMEQRLNRVREQGIALALRKAAREKADAISDATRLLRTSGSQARIAELGYEVFGANEADTLGRQEAAQAQVDGITDKIRDMRRRLEDTPGDTWLPQFIEKLEAIKGRFQSLRDIVGTTQEAMARIAQDLGTNVGKALEDGLGSSIEGLITRTKTLGDVVKTMYSEITRAAIQYLMKFALISAGSKDGSFAGLISSLVGSGGAATEPTVVGADVIQNLSLMPSANGNVFSKFARGGTFTNSIVRGPTQFPMGLMGEAGPEAIMPLRNVNGKLGVAATGGGGGDQYNINITAVDAASVSRLFSEHGGALVDSLRHRDKLNRGYRNR